MPRHQVSSRQGASRKAWRSCVARIQLRRATRRGAQQPRDRRAGARRNSGRDSELEAAARLKPNDDSVRFNLGNGYYAAGRRADAVRELTRAVALNGENADAHFNLAMISGRGPGGRGDRAPAPRARDRPSGRTDAQRNLTMALGSRRAALELFAASRRRREPRARGTRTRRTAPPSDSASWPATMWRHRRPRLEIQTSVFTSAASCSTRRERRRERQRRISASSRRSAEREPDAHDHGRRADERAHDGRNPQIEDDSHSRAV
jgi:tetratricopeptide (TPR) repeat protein